MSIQKLPPLSQLERVEQSLLSERLDEMLDRVEKEEIAYVITENGQDKAVLCPYWWFEGNSPDDVGRVGISAIQYELAAESENADAVRQFVRHHYAAFDDRTLTTMVKDMETHLAPPLCQAANPEVWRPLKAMLEEELRKRENTQEGKHDE